MEQLKEKHKKDLQTVKEKARADTRNQLDAIKNDQARAKIE